MRKGLRKNRVKVLKLPVMSGPAPQPQSGCGPEASALCSSLFVPSKDQSPSRQRGCEGPLVGDLCVCRHTEGPERTSWAVCTQHGPVSMNSMPASARITGVLQGVGSAWLKPVFLELAALSWSYYQLLHPSGWHSVERTCVGHIKSPRIPQWGCCWYECPRQDCALKQ